MSTETTEPRTTFPRLKAPKDRKPEEIATDQLWAAMADKSSKAPEFLPGAVIRFVVRDKFAAGRPWRAYAAILSGSYWTIGGTGHLHQLPMQTTENLVSILRQQEFDSGTHNLTVLSLGDRSWQL